MSNAVQWSSGYDFCLTHRRSPVRSRIEPTFFSIHHTREHLARNLSCHRIDAAHFMDVRTHTRSNDSDIIRYQYFLSPSFHVIATFSFRLPIRLTHVNDSESRGQCYLTLNTTLWASSHCPVFHRKRILRWKGDGSRAPDTVLTHDDPF
jgi:hypothetical protein